MATSSPSKRPHDQDATESNGTGKRLKSEGDCKLDQRSKFFSDGLVFRLLCPASKLGRITGVDGSLMSQTSEETGTEVRVGETTPGCDERIVFIRGAEKENQVKTEPRGKDDSKEDEAAEAGDGRNENSGNDENKKSDRVVDSKSVVNASSLQKALFLVFEKLVEAELETNGADAEKDKPSTFILRLLVLSSQVGCLLGRGGSVVKQMAAESGAQIRILPRDKLPSCASASDELVQITGKADAVRKALQAVSQQLLGNSLCDQDSSSANHMGPSSHSSSHPVYQSEAYTKPNHFHGSQWGPGAAGPQDFADFHSSVPTQIPKFLEAGIPNRMMPLLKTLTFRLLCPDERVGGIIGKGGAVVRTLQHDTGCEVKIVEGFSDSKDRVVAISGPAHPDDRISPAQDAVLRAQARISRAIPDLKDKNVTARLLVSSNQIGCLLGKGGSVIADMRKFTGAHIRIGNEQIPKGSSDSDQIVQISGEFEAVQEALLQITTRLRHHFFRDAFPSVHHPLNPAFLDLEPPFPSYMGRREFSPPGPYSNHGPSLHKFDRLGGPPHGDFYPHDDLPPFMHNIPPGMPLHLRQRRPWAPQGLIEDDGPIGLPDFVGGSHRSISGFERGSQPAIIVNTTVEVVVPSSLIPVIYGEDGACLKQIRQISDAKVMITDPKPGATETLIVISGTPEQTNAAQSLIQAFVLCETKGF